MGFWSFLRDMFMFDWLSGNNRKGGKPVNQTNRHANCDCEYDAEYESYRNSDCSHSCRDDGNYADYDSYADDCCHDSYDDCANDFGDFDDDY